MPWDPAYRKPGVQGITANAIDVVIETGDSGPVTPVGINLPNDQAIRERYGSKSVSLSNVSEAYDKSTLPEFRSEFSWTPEESARATKWSAFAGDLTTNMHEVIGHASGKVEERLKGNPAALLKEQFSALEEGRADLVALYFLPDPKLAEIGILAAADQDEIVRTEYEAYARNALVQLRRVREGTQIEEDHMRNRQMVVRWLIANTKAIDVRTRDGKTYYVVTDPKAFREGVGRLLAEVQRIKAQGDYPAAKLLFETYGVHFDPKLRDEVVARVQKLNLPSYTGFVMPKLDAVEERLGRGDRRRHFVSDGFHEADARVLGGDARLAVGMRMSSGAGRAGEAGGPGREERPHLPAPALPALPASSHRHSSGIPPHRSARRAAGARQRCRHTPRDRGGRRSSCAHRRRSRPHSIRCAERRRADRSHCGQGVGTAGAARADRRHRADPEASVARNPRRGRQRHRTGGAGVDTPAAVDRAPDQSRCRRRRADRGADRRSRSERPRRHWGNARPPAVRDGGSGAEGGTDAARADGPKPDGRRSARRRPRSGGGGAAAPQAQLHPTPI